MVNIVDTFTAMYGRKPTESELAFMQRVKAEREARFNKNIAPSRNLIDQSKKSQETAKAAAKNRPFQQAILVTYRAFTINKLLQFDLSVAQIAEALDVKESSVNFDIDKYRLPRKMVRRK